MLREVVFIDEERCDGCGLCVPACEEGALRIVNGKARLVSERACDGLGACLGHCPRGAIRIEQREAEPFSHPCPGAASYVPEPPAGAPACRPASAAAPASPASSALRQWPVQLRLLSPDAPALRGASLLVAADCVPVAYGGFQGELLAGRAIAIACPKLDDPRGYVEKLADIIARNAPPEIIVARMEVPCCAGILRAVLAARQMAGATVPISDVVVSVRGAIRSRQPVPAGPPEMMPNHPKLEILKGDGRRVL